MYQPCDVMLQTEMALMHDAVFLFARALHRLYFKGEESFEVQSLDCDAVNKWAYGFPLAHYMKIVSTRRVLRVMPISASTLSWLLENSTMGMYLNHQTRK
jgi:hypothetical protein